MFNLFSQWFNHLLRQFTYRQRFVFWAFLFLLSPILPMYWILRTEQFFISRVELQLEGVKKTKVWNEVFESFLKYYVNWSVMNANGEFAERELAAFQRVLLKNIEVFKQNSLNQKKALKVRGLFNNQIREINIQKNIKYLEQLSGIFAKEISSDSIHIEKMYSQIMNELVKKIHQTVFDFEIILQMNEQTAQLVQTLFFSLLHSQVLLTEIHLMVIKIKQMENSSEELKNRLLAKIKYFKSHFQNLYLGDQSINSFSDSQYMEIKELLFNCFRINVQFANAIQEIIQESEVSSTQFIYTDVLTLKTLDSIGKCQAIGISTLNTILIAEKKKYIYELMTVVLFFAISLFLVFFYVVFRMLTRHFSEMLAYIEALTRGEFSSPLHTKPDEEMGQIAFAFHKMGQTFHRVLNKLQALRVNLDGSIKKIDDTTHAQANSVILQESSLAHLENTLQQIANNSRKLAETMNAFTIESKQLLVESSNKKRLSDMQNKMELLAQASRNILNTLLLAHDKVTSTRKLAKFMTKVSEQAALLALNAEIEAINIETYTQIFTDITKKIRRFADSTSFSTLAIQRVIKEMFQSVEIGKNQAEGCLNEISVGATRLINVSQQLTKIAQKDEEQTDKFQIVNEMIQKQAKISGAIIETITYLSKTVKENTSYVRELYQTIEELNDTAKQLSDVSAGLFTESEKK